MTEIQKLENQMYETYQKLVQLRRDSLPIEVKNYKFQTLEGETSLREMFGDKETLFVIHNMGQGCTYCTLWADGLNSFLPHLEEKYAVVLVSKDEPKIQRRFANDRGWRYRMASHNGGEYIKEQSTSTDANNPAAGNYPGVICYEKRGEKIYKKNSSPFGPGDEFCSIWNLISLAGDDESHWSPEYHYWQGPKS